MEGWKKYSAKSYLRERFKAPDAYRTEWPLQCFHEFYSKYHGEWDTTSARLLEFGGGPTIYGLISASGYVSEIVFSDYVEENRKAVEEWKNAGPCGYDWGPYFKYVVEKLEDDQSLGAAIRRESELRSQITSITGCNIHNPDPVDTPIPPLFDIVSIIFCLTAACTSQDDFRESLQKLGELVKPGGFVILLDALELSWVTIDGEPVECVYVTKEFITKAIEDAGLVVLETKHYELPQSVRDTDCNNTGREFLVAKKTL